MNEKTVNNIVMAIVAVVVFAFTYAGFFGPQDCDIDRVNLSCRLHPFSVGDFIGCVMFYGVAAYLGGFLKLLGLDPWVKGSTLNYVLFGVGILGIILIWNT
jgi:hypothetical protein